jgi:DNA-binding NarL/FixJ family response regulator
VSGCSVLVADDHPALVAAIGSYLQEHGYDVVGPARDGEAAVQLAASRPDLAVVDWRMPRLGGAELVRALLAASPETSVAVYTADADDALAREALAAGAAAIVLKDAPLADLLRALESLRQGRAYVDPALGRSQGTRAPLTARELDVLRLLADGLRHEEIGLRLGIGSETVRTHLRKASDRLGAATRTQAVATALRRGLIS